MSCNLKFTLYRSYFPVLGIDPYCNLKTTGVVHLVRTGIPFSFAGVHFGIALTTRRASLSSDGSTLLITLTSDMEPSFSMILSTITRPCTPFSCATSGYFTLLLDKTSLHFHHQEKMAFHQLYQFH